ncbi:MAG: 30S ribosomal protein S17 [Spirochaetaceae bacterium]|nr:30S ribosomal protein S17 [Spirochaetaceae bacterium]MEE0133934.1 30S ribosomal protein S17 [Treponema sp.]MBQ7366683.1 30S ribosomal protein S17 [Spirochaetaceae bacterium]MBQ8385243.1 30S ribosomal protein S17 [Spirochaetaceae bacterium]MBQ8560319.1 30S ribosomal protein S17 [Spirochaetaceae bacterium]
MEEQVVQTNKAAKRSFVGIVTSDKMDKTIVVSVTTKKLHRLYKKYVTRVKKCKAHDELNDAHIGDKVRIVECRPLSKEKCWRLAEIIERAR